MRVAHVDGSFGAAGDMLLGAIVGAGLALPDLSRELSGLPIASWRLVETRVQRAGLAATKVDVEVSDDQQPRTVAEILDLVGAATLPVSDIEQARRVFSLLGEAERDVHGRDGEPHLHEVGATDAIIDVVGTIVGLRLLGVERLSCGPLRAGHGSVRARHGLLPVPAPAVLAIAARTGVTLLPTHPAEPASELLTPTAAAILGALAEPDAGALRVTQFGHGAGSRDFEGWPNMVRLWLGELPAPSAGVRPLSVVETNVDDMPGEQVPFLEARLRDAGALDVWWTPAQMKKGRPGVQITAVCDPAAAGPVVDAMLEHSSTLGVRVSEVQRHEARRSMLAVETAWGVAEVKLKHLPDGRRVPSVEYESARALAEEQGLPIAQVYEAIVAAARAQLDQA